MQKEMKINHEYVGLAAWKRLLLIAGMLLPGGASLVALAPSQVAYGQQSPFVCEAGNGGNGGVANHRSSGGDGAAGGGCPNGPRGGDAGVGGEAGSPGGPGGNVFF